MKSQNRIHNHWPAIALLIVVVVLSFLNFNPESYLIGWDNLLPEFSLKMNILRSVFSVWQEYQSLGLLGGMAHASDLPRQIILLILSAVIPARFLRYFWTFSMLLTGTLGAYQLSKNTLVSRFHLHTKNISSFFAGLFYLLNLATMQNFYVPFEPFVTFFGFLPWLVLFSIKYLNRPNRTNFTILGLTLLLSSPSYYTQATFLVLMVIFLCIYLERIITHRFAIKQLGTIISHIVLVFITQAYWLLPVAYFALTSSNVTTNSHQNLLYTPEIIARNQEYGDLKSILSLKGFWFQNVDLNANNQFQQMLEPWINHLNNHQVELIGYVFLFIMVIGLFYSIKRKLPHTFAFILSSVICAFYLINYNFPSQPLFQFLNQQFPLLSQIFRSVFTKWSVPFALMYSLFFSVGVIFLLDIFSLLDFKLTPHITSYSLVLLIIIYMNPAFQGHYIYTQMEHDIPSEYFQLFDYFKKQDPNTRIANFPQITHWGWQYYRWGYRGSGFLWYGIEQPLLDRAFDVWSPYSEKYYEEMKIALYSQNTLLFQSLLEKYSIGWILLDKSIIVPGQDDQSTLYNDQLVSMLNQLPNVSLEKQFGSLLVYKIHTQGFTPYSFTTAPADLPLIIDTSTSHRSPLKAPKNCDNFNSAAFDRVLTDEAITYSATDAQSCDHFLYSFLPHGSAYEFRITHKNITGSPFLVCLEDYVSHQCLINKYLPKSADWITTTLTIPPMKPGEYGYTLHFLNYSIGRVETKNQLRQIEVVPVSYTLSTLSTNDYELTTQLAIITSFAKLNYSHYKVTVTSSPGSDALVLDQAFHPGWQAFVDGQWKTPLTTHFEGSGWKNAWRIPAGNHQVDIIFLPQFLQYLGFALLPLLLPILLLHRGRPSFRT